jgi:molybdopterin molybdotransferase
MSPTPPPAPEAALAAMLAALGPTPAPFEAARAATAGGRVLVSPVHAERDQPPFDRVMMDGIAVQSAALRGGRRRFRLAGVAAAGHPAPPLESAADAVEAMTGAMVPHGADCIIPVEELSRGGDTVVVSESAATGAVAGLNIHPQGSDCREGDAVLQAPQRLGAVDVAIATGAGAATLPVRRTCRIAVISTGDELVEAGEPLAPWQVRRSNAHAVATALRAAGHANVTDHHLPDDLSRLEMALAELLATHEVLVLSGGVSMGQFDHVPAALRTVGVHQVLHRIAQRPGQPLWFGRGPEGQSVFGLPGNPVSTFACTVRYVLPVLQHLAGEPVRRAGLPVQLAGSAKTLKVTRLLPVVLDVGPTGQLLATPRPPANSGDFLTLAGTTGMVELPPGEGSLPAATVVPYWPWPDSDWPMSSS